MWIKTAFMIRYGYALRLHVRRKTPLPADEAEARAILDRERTWLNLSVSVRRASYASS